MRWGTETVCPERCWLPHPWRHYKARLNGALSTWIICRWPCSLQRTWTIWPLRVLSNSNVFTAVEVKTVLDEGAWCKAPSENKKKMHFFSCCFATSIIAQSQHSRRPPVCSAVISETQNLSFWARLKQDFLLCRKKPEVPGTLDCNHNLVHSILAKVSRAHKFPVLKLCFRAKKSHL